MITATGLSGVGGNVIVAATGRAEADAYAAAWGGGAVAIGASNAKSTVDPTVAASVGAGTMVTALGDVRITATVSRTPENPAPPPDGSIDSVDSDDTLVVDFPLHTGDQVLYFANGGQIDGLAICDPAHLDQCRLYPVTVLEPSVDGGPATIAFDQTFALRSVDALTDVITFRSEHFFVSGDAVRRLPGGQLDLVEDWQGIDEAAVLYVRVIDSERIRLVSTYAAAIASDDSLLRAFTVASGGTYLTTAGGAPYAIGTAVTYEPRRSSPSPRTR